MKVLLLLLLTGLCSGIQFPLQYVYHYRASVSSGIPDINKRHSAVSELKADLTVYVTSPTRLVFKLTGVTFVDTNGVRECDGCNKGHLSATTPPSASQLGQFPFAVENGVITFNAEEEAWTINFYKSIVSLFNIAPLKEAFYKTSSNHSRSAAYYTTEDTVMGKCRTTYTQHKLTGVGAAKQELFVDHHVTQDVQKRPLGAIVTTGPSKTTKTTSGRRRKRQAPAVSKKTPTKTSQTRVEPVPAISNTLWEVVRSVNLEDCEDRVEHQHSLDGLYCVLGKDQCQNLFSRNSHGAYSLRGDANGMRLEKAVIRGAIVISPFGVETEHIETITKQGLALVSVNHLATVPPTLAGATTITTNKLVYELTLPYAGVQNTNYRWAKLGTMKETMAALTGEHNTVDTQRANEARVINMLKLAAEQSAGGNTAAAQQAPVLLNYASILMYDFTKEEITRVATGLPQASLDLFFGVLAEVGSAPAVDVMLDLIKNGKVSALRQVFYFGTLNMNIKSAASLRPILNFLKTQNLDTAPFKTSQSLINFASVVKKLCLGRRDAANSFNEFAYQICTRDGIVKDLKDYLASQLQGATAFWKQMVLVRALVNLKTVEATNTLLPYVMGTRECDTMVRAVAMDSLAKWNAANPLYKSKIVLILLDIFENPAESPLLRARALGYLTSWELSSTDWTRLAFSTKRHGLKDLSAFTYSLIKATADFEHPDMIQQRQYASHALSLAKPSSSAERYSSVKAWFRYAFDVQIGQVNHFSLVKDPMSPLPADLSVYIQRSLGGAVFYRKMDFMIVNDNGDLKDIASELLLGLTSPNIDGSAKGRWTNFLNTLKTDLDIEAKLKKAIRGMTSMVSVAQARLFIPFDRVMLVDAIRSFSGDRTPNLRLTGPSSLYMNSVDKTFTTINDLGLPVITNVARPSVISYKGSANFQISEDEFTLSTESFGFIVSSFFRVNIETIIPWSHSKVAAGVSNTVTLNLPLSPTVKFSWNSDKRNPSFLIANVAPSVFAKTVVLNMVNMPYTLIRGTAPSDLEGLTKALKIIYVNGEKGPKYLKSKSLPAFTGLEETLASDFPISFGSEESFFSALGSDTALEKLFVLPTLKFYSGAISADLSGLQTSSVRLNFTAATADRLPSAGKLVSKYGQDRFEEYELCGSKTPREDTQQTNQQTNDDYMDQQSSQSAQNPDQEFETFGGFGQQQQSQAPGRLRDDTTAAETVRPSQGIGDVSQPQLRSFLNYLQTLAGWKSVVNGLSLRFEVLKGGVSSLAYEAVAAETKCYALVDQVLHKSVLVIAKQGDPCDTLCFESEVTRPKINDLDTMALLLARNLNSTRNLAIYTGKKCSVGPIQTLKVQHMLTGAGRQRLVEKYDNLQKCGSHWGPPQNLVKDFAETAQYDRFEYNTNVTKVDNLQCKSPFLQLLLTKGWIKIRETGSKLKQHFFNSCPGDFGPNGLQISGVGKRSEDGTFSWVESSNQKVLTQTTPALPRWADDALKIGYQTELYEHSHMYGDFCVIDEQKVITFDGMRVNFTAGPCSVVASTTCEGHIDTFAVAVRTSSSGGLAVQIVGQVTQLIINVNRAGIDVNGVPMKADEFVKTLHYPSANRGQQVAGYIYKRNGFYKVEILDTFDVLLKEGKVYIEVADRYRGAVCGMCGNYDDEPSNDLKAPNGCLITDSEQFAKAWTPTVGFDCVGEQTTNPDTCLKEEPLPRDFYQQYQL